MLTHLALVGRSFKCADPFSHSTGKDKLHESFREDLLELSCGFALNEQITPAAEADGDPGNQVGRSTVINYECSSRADVCRGGKRDASIMRRWVRAAEYGWEFLGRACAVGR